MQAEGVKGAGCKWVITALEVGDNRCLNRCYDVKEGIEMGHSSLAELIIL